MTCRALFKIHLFFGRETLRSYNQPTTLGSYSQYQVPQGASLCGRDERGNVNIFNKIAKRQLSFSIVFQNVIWLAFRHSVHLVKVLLAASSRTR